MSNDSIGPPKLSGRLQREALTPLQLHFRRRLAYLTALKTVLYASPNTDWKKVELVLRAKASTLRDCFAQGVGDLAIDIEILMKPGDEDVVGKTEPEVQS